MEGSRNRYARHLGINGLCQGSAVLDRFVGQVRAIGGNEDVRVHNCNPSKNASPVKGACRGPFSISKLTIRQDWLGRPIVILQARDGPGGQTVSLSGTD